MYWLAPTQADSGAAEQAPIAIHFAACSARSSCSLHLDCRRLGNSSYYSGRDNYDIELVSRWTTAVRSLTPLSSPAPLESKSDARFLLLSALGVVLLWNSVDLAGQSACRSSVRFHLELAPQRGILLIIYLPLFLPSLLLVAAS